MKKNVRRPSVRFVARREKADGARQVAARRRRGPRRGPAAARRRRARAAAVPEPASRVGSRAAHGVKPKTPERGGVGPVEQGRLLEVGNAVEARDDEVVRRPASPAGSRRSASRPARRGPSRAARSRGPPSGAGGPRRGSARRPSSARGRRFDHGCEVYLTGSRLLLRSPALASRSAHTLGPGPGRLLRIRRGLLARSGARGLERVRRPPRPQGHPAERRTASSARSARPAAGPSSSTSTRRTTRSAREVVAAIEKACGERAARVPRVGPPALAGLRHAQAVLRAAARERDRQAPDRDDARRDGELARLLDAGPLLRRPARRPARASSR